MWEPVTLRAEPVGPRNSKDGMSGKKKGFREGGPECLRQAHQSRKGHGPEDAGAGRPRASRAMLGGDAEALLDAYGLEDVPIGRLDLTPSLIERARTERRDAPLA